MNFIGVLLWVSGAAVGVDEGTSDYLSDVLDERVFYHTQGWGELGIDTAVRPTDGRAPLPLRIKNTTYEKGIGHHAPGEIVVELNGDYTAFAAEVGVQRQGGNTVASAVFQVYVDGQLRFDSAVMKEQDPPRRVEVSLNGADLLRLVVTDAGDGITCDCANWANARLFKAYAPTPRPAAEPVDMAPFAQVVTWDPNRMDGAKSNRVQEFRAEDVFLASPVKPANGIYPVPVAKDGRGCIGLQWAETRLVRELGLEFAGTPSPTEAVEAQYWTGESPWQGTWKTLKGAITQENHQWKLVISTKENDAFPRSGVDKIRWVFPPSKERIRLKKLAAYTRSRWDTASLRLELETPAPGQQGTVELYNGMIVDGVDSLHCPWDLGNTLILTARYTRPKPWKTDRTVLRIRLPQGACGIAVEDVIRAGAVYVRGLGLYATPATGPMDVAQYRQSIQDRKTVLERVREMPDQTFAQALEKAHNPVQNNGPMMLSLACDNRKFIAHRDGAVQFEPCGEAPHDKDGLTQPTHRLVPRFGSGKDENRSRHLEGERLPAPVITIREGDVLYRQCTFVAPSGEPAATAPLWLTSHPLGVVDFHIENSGEQASEVSLVLTLFNGTKPYNADKIDGGAVFAFGGQLLAYVDARKTGPLVCAKADGAVSISGSLPPHATAHCYVYVPAWSVLAENYKPPADAAELFSAMKTYWERILADAMQVEIPDPLLANVIRASQVHCFLAARNELDGKAVAAWIASDRYGPLESEAHSVILGMDGMGQHEFARRALEFFINRYNAQGYLTTGYTMMGTGWHLWTLARHVELTGDKAWFEAVAPKVAGVCQWICQQREKTRNDGPDVRETPECGLMPPGVGADWNRFAYRFAIQAHYHAGLHEAAQALATINYPTASKLLATARSFR